MKIYRDISEVVVKEKSVVTVGTFDGVHKGHKDIIDFVVHEALTENAENFVVTFEPHPRLVVSSNFSAGILTSLDEKAVLFEKLNVQNMLVVKFDKNFANTGYEDFVKYYLVERIKAKHIVIGHDHKFGKGRGGDENSLKALSVAMNFELTVIPPVKEFGVEISSTKIRQALYEGKVSEANKFLGRNYSLPGKVVEGVQRGRQIGFPTANIEPFDKNKLIPALGVYAVKCLYNEKYLHGVLNIGKRPTFENQDIVFIELHILNFENNIYGASIEIEFIEKLRDEKKFNSVDELKEQINKDIIKTKQIFN